MTAKPKFRGKNVALTISSLLMLPELQTRELENPDHIDDLLAVLVKRKSLPRVKVIYVDTGRHVGHLVVDGHHTVKAYRKAGRKSVPCTVRHGTWEDAVIAAAGANTEHLGLKRTNADKQRAVQLVLAELGSEWTDGRIAEHVGVSSETVRRARGRLPASPLPASPPPSPATRTGADGRQYATSHKKGDGWENTPIGDLGLKGFQTPVWAEFAERKVKTAGDLSRILTGYKREDERLRLPNPILKGITTQLEAHKAEWEREHGEPAAVKPAPVEKPAAEFDWKAAAASWGPMARLPDTIGRVYPDFKRSTEYAALGRLANEAIGLVKAVQKRLTAKEK